MMKKMFFINIIMILWACNEPIIPPIDTTPQSWQPEIVWRKQHGPTKYDQKPFRIELYKDKLIAGYQSEIGSGYWIYDKNTGETIKDIQGQNSFIIEPSTKRINNLYISNMWKREEFRIINLDDYEINTTSKNIDGSNFTPIVYFDGFIYDAYPHMIPSNKVSFHRSKLNQINNPWEEILVDLWPKDVPNPRSSHPFCVGLKHGENKDHILFYGNSQLYHDKYSTDARIRFNAYNVDRKQMLWQTQVERKSVGEDVWADDGGGFHAPCFYEDKVIMMSARTIRGFQIDTGKLLWEHNLKYITTTDYAVIHNYFYICDNVGLLYKIDLNTGEIVSKLQMQNGNTGVWQVHKDIIYFTTVSGNLWAVDSEKMQVKWKWKSENSQNCSYCSFGNNSPIIDHENERLYITDGREMFCIKLPES
jgi:hypothetical protein